MPSCSEVLEAPLESSWLECPSVLFTHCPALSWHGVWGNAGKFPNVEPGQCCNAFGIILKWREACTSDSHILGSCGPEVSLVAGGQFSFILWHAEVFLEYFLKADETLQKEHKQTLNFKIAKQYKSFLKFTHEHVRACYGTKPKGHVADCVFQRWSQHHLSSHMLFLWWYFEISLFFFYWGI